MRQGDLTTPLHCTATAGVMRPPSAVLDAIRFMALCRCCAPGGGFRVRPLLRDGEQVIHDVVAAGDADHGESPKSEVLAGKLLQH